MNQKRYVQWGAVLLSLTMLSGCKPSPVLTEVLYDDKAPEPEPTAPVSAIENREEHTDRDDTLSPNAKDEEADAPRDRERLDPVPSQPPPEPTVLPQPEPSEAPAAPLPLPEPPAPLPAPGQAVRQVVDDHGRVIDLPETVESLAATGRTAPLLSLFGGDRLAAPLPDTPMSQEAFLALLAQPPQACLVLSGQSVFTEEQLLELEAQQVGVVTLPPLNSGENICQAVELTAQVLGGEAPGTAAAYRSFYNDILQLLSSRVPPADPEQPKDPAEATFALFLDGWDDSVSYQLHDDAYTTLEGVGLPVALTGRSASPVSDLLALSGVVNTPAMAENSYSVLDSQLRYVCPIDTPNKALTTTGSLDAGYDRRYLLTTAGGACLGDERFHTVIVPDRETADKLAACPLWTNYGPVRSATGLTSGYGFLDQNGDIVTTSIRGAYTILALPDPAWADGCPESILLPLWSACHIRQAVTPEELAQLTARYEQLFPSAPGGELP